jgi:hypothetical protein
MDDSSVNNTDSYLYCLASQGVNSHSKAYCDYEYVFTEDKIACMEEAHIQSVELCDLKMLFKKYENM